MDCKVALRQLGVTFSGAKTGKEALVRLRALAQDARSSNTPVRQKVAMVLTDLEMPEVDGFILTRSIKEDDTAQSCSCGHPFFASGLGQ